MNDTKLHSPSEDVTTEPGGITQIVRNFFGGGTRAQDTILALAIFVIIVQGIFLWSAWRHQSTQAWLADYDLNHFEAGPFAALKSRVDTNAALIQAFGPQQCKRGK